MSMYYVDVMFHPEAILNTNKPILSLNASNVYK